MLLNKIERAFEHPLFAKRTLRELKILRLLSHENVIDLMTIQKPLPEEKLDIAKKKDNSSDSQVKFDLTNYPRRFDIYAVFDIMETSLVNIVKSNQELSVEHMQFFLYQILRGMKYIHSAGVLHRDLKPQNLLVNSNCDLKI